MHRVFLGIGSNEGDRLANVSRAIQDLIATPAIRVVQMATVYETEPVGPPQSDFLNTVVELETTLPPRALLRALKALERKLGRVPAAPRWGPRPIDLDILFYDDRIVQEPDLTIPHARLHERRFVLQPLAQLAPDFVHPVLGQRIAELLEHLPSAAPA